MAPQLAIPFLYTFRDRRPSCVVGFFEAQSRDNNHRQTDCAEVWSLPSSMRMPSFARSPRGPLRCPDRRWTRPPCFLWLAASGNECIQIVEDLIHPTLRMSCMGCLQVDNPPRHTHAACYHRGFGQCHSCHPAPAVTKIFPRQSVAFLSIIRAALSTVMLVPCTMPCGPIYMGDPAVI